MNNIQEVAKFLRSKIETKPDINTANEIIEYLKKLDSVTKSKILYLIENPDDSVSLNESYNGSVEEIIKIIKTKS